MSMVFVTGCEGPPTSMLTGHVDGGFNDVGQANKFDGATIVVRISSNQSERCRTVAILQTSERQIKCFPFVKPNRRERKDIQSGGTIVRNPSPRLIVH
jgi:hypothetical protein